MAARSTVVLCALLTVLLGGCTRVGGSDPSPSLSTAPPRPFTVVTTDPILTTDPAAVADSGSELLTLNVFQTLLTAEPGDVAPKPDAAKDCQVDTPRSYLCTLKPGLTFHNGHPLTSSDVKFSIQRAMRLNVPGSSAPLLDSIRSIETPDPLTVRFILSRPDAQLQWALASPAAAIVDEQVYSPDVVRGTDQPIALQVDAVLDVRAIDQGEPVSESAVRSIHPGAKQSSPSSAPARALVLEQLRPVLEDAVWIAGGPADPGARSSEA